MSPWPSTICSQPGRGVDVRRCMSASRAAVAARRRAETAAHDAGARDADVGRVRVRAAGRHAPPEGVRAAAVRIVIPAVQPGAVPARLGIALGLVHDAPLLIRTRLPAGPLAL